MTNIETKHSLILGLFICLACLFLLPLGLSAQFGEQQLLAADALSLNMLVEEKQEQNAPLLEDPLAFEQLRLAPQKPAPASYRATKISREHYVDNPYDLEDFSNPFNLPKKGQQLGQRKAKLAKDVDMDKFWSELFAPKEQPAVLSTSTQKAKRQPAWLLFALLGQLLLFAFLLTAYRSETYRDFWAYGNLNIAGQEEREQRFQQWSAYNVLSYLQAGFALGSFIYLSSNFMRLEEGQLPDWSFANFAFLLAGTTAAYTARQAILRLLGELYPIGQEMSFYGYLNANQHRIMGFSLLPMLFLLAYSAPDLQGLLPMFLASLLGLSFAYTALRAAFTALDTVRFHKFQFFLYLCTVEIAPPLILLKFLSII